MIETHQNLHGDESNVDLNDADWQGNMDDVNIIYGYISICGLVKLHFKNLFGLSCCL
jgi:hypothetical protein